MKLTPVGKLFLALVVIVVVGFVVYRKYGEQIQTWANQGQPNKPQAIDKDDFGSISKDIKDPDQKQVVNVTAPSKGPLGDGKLNRPLKVAINTWAGHAPGIVANGGL